MQNLIITEALDLLSKVSNKKNSIYPRRLVRESNEFGKFKIIEFVKSEEYIEYGSKIRYHHYFKIKFIKTGYETVAKLKNINDGSVKDMLYPNVKGVGYLGEDYDKIRTDDNELFKILYNRWYNVLNRCYSPKHPEYNNFVKVLKNPIFRSKICTINDTMLNLKPISIFDSLKYKFFKK